MRRFLPGAVSFLLAGAPAVAQSLNPKTPTPLQPGINTSTVDNVVGTQYWYFDGLPGDIHVHCNFKPMSMLGANFQNSINISLSDAAGTWKTPKTLSSNSKITDCTFDGKLTKPTRVIVTVAPPSGGLVRMGGDYQITVTGAVAFGAPSSSDPVVGTYKEMSGYTKDLGDCKFNADGTVVTTSGESGNWKLFDKDSGTYVVDIAGQERATLQFKSGRGLCDGDSIVFQALR